jgi:hypothetical protein
MGIISKMITIIISKVTITIIAGKIIAFIILFFIMSLAIEKAIKTANKYNKS